MSGFPYRLPFLIPTGGGSPGGLPVAKVTRGISAAALARRPISIGTADDPNPYGVEIRCMSDIDPFFSTIGGIEVLAQDQFHAITCAAGSVPGRENTIDVRDLLSQGVTQADLQTIQSMMASVLQDDERIQQASVMLEFDQDEELLTVKAVNLPINPQGSPQPFQFIASISAIGSTLLSVSPVGG